MGRTVFRWAGVVVLVVAGLLAPPFARVGWACTCSTRPVPLSEHVDEASAVFVGRVVATEQVSREEHLPGRPKPIVSEMVKVSFDVVEQWKGVPDPWWTS